MRIKVDEDLPQAVITLLRQSGYSVDGVLEQGMSGWKDQALWQAVQREGRFFVTADKGFGDIRRYPPERHGGVLLLRPQRQSIAAYLELLQQLLSRFRLEEFRGCLVVVTPKRVRLRCKR